MTDVRRRARCITGIRRRLKYGSSELYPETGILGYKFNSSRNGHTGEFLSGEDAAFFSSYLSSSSLLYVVLARTHTTFTAAGLRPLASSPPGSFRLRVSSRGRAASSRRAVSPNRREEYYACPLSRAERDYRGFSRATVSHGKPSRILDDSGMNREFNANRQYSL